MKKMTGVRAILLLSCMAIVFSLASCDTPMDKQEIRYTVWRGHLPYKEFEKVFRGTLIQGILEDKHFMWYEFDAAQWGRLSKNLSDTGKYMWTKDQIKKWLLDEGLSEEQAAKVLTWLTTVEHGYIASRYGDTVELLFK